MKLEFMPFPVIKTDNYCLRAVAPKDLDRMFLFRTDKTVAESEGVYVDKNKTETLGFMDKMSSGVRDGKWIYWVIVDHEERLVGSISIWNFNSGEQSGELGYGVISEYQHQGIMSEVIPFVEKFAFQGIGLKYLNAYTNKENENSLKLLKKCGYPQVLEIDEKNQKGKMVTMVKHEKRVKFYQNGTSP